VTAPAIDARFTLRKVGLGSSFEVDVELVLDRGLLVLFGPSGSGKTLTLEGLAGLAEPSSGFVRLSGETLYDAEKHVWVPPHRRGVGYVPQRASLFPFTDVLGNVGFGLPRAARRGPASMSLLEELGLAHRAGSRPEELSGGERQRVALARALASSPRLLLLDEPFASIDRAGRAQLGKTLRDILAKKGTPAVFVTHDAVEAAEMGDLLLPMENGRGRTAVKPAEFFRSLSG
jgi:ABC-type sulfate/molybdate transport systems ATPase subunit